jgi:hypothetical protein
MYGDPTLASVFGEAPEVIVHGSPAHQDGRASRCAPVHADWGRKK